MGARIDFSPRRFLASALIASVAAGSPLLWACSKGDGSTALEFTPAAMKSLPSVRSKSAALSTAALYPAPTTSTLHGFAFAHQLFEMQCRQPDSGVDYCPPGTPEAPRSGPDPYRFTMQALIGFIFHAQMYSSLVTECSGDGLSPMNIAPGSYAAASSSSGADPTRFILDAFSSYTCRSVNVSNASAETRALSAVADGSYQSTLHTRHAYDAGDGRPQTDLFQVDLSIQSGAPEFLAFNFASAAPFRSRLVLLANLATRRFALKYYTPSQPGDLGSTWAPERYAVAAGTGGFDLGTGAPNSGHYWVDFLDEPMAGEQKSCVDNDGAAFESDASLCDAEGVPTAWTSGEAVRAYLGIPAAHAARLAPFLAVFETADPLGPEDAWRRPGDEDLYWPKGLH
jgi:hypothetical protein